MNDEQGVSAVLMAVILLPLLGMVALAVDVGLMYEEVRQLQNGADAAALALAQECAEAEDGCDPDDPIETAARLATARSFTDGNSRDGASGAEVMYPGLDGDTSVTVTATVLEPDGAGSLSFLFARVFGLQDALFSRSATAAAGPAGFEATLPVTFSACELAQFQAAQDAGSTEPVIISLSGALTGGGEGTGCEYGGPGFDLPGGFGYLDLNETGKCQADILLPPDRTIADPGIDPPGPGGWQNGPCTQSFFEDLLEPGVRIPIPVFDETTIIETGPEQKTYEIAGFAWFEITGYNLSGGTNLSSTPAPACPGSGSSGRCIAGRFVEGVGLDGFINNTGLDLGYDTVQLTR